MAARIRLSRIAMLSCFEPQARLPSRLVGCAPRPTAHRPLATAHCPVRPSACLPPTVPCALPPIAPESLLPPLYSLSPSEARSHLKRRRRCRSQGPRF